MRTSSPKHLRNLTVLAATFVLLMMIAPAASAQGKQDFTLVNKTGLAISEMYIGPNSSDDWGPDILGRDTLPSGQSTDIVFDPRTKAARWDIKLIDEDGKEHIYYNINLIRIATITVRPKGDANGTWLWTFEE